MTETPASRIVIDGRAIGADEPTYFIADIAANHDGDLERAKSLIHLAAEAGADAAKFQHFAARSIVSDRGFRELRTRQSHQAAWKKSVFEVYEDASIDLGWTPILKETCDVAGITFFTSPYSFELVDAVDPYVPAYKVGSGDITWLDIIEHIARKHKPVFVATGAATAQDVQRAVETVLRVNPALVLMQCNTNYTGSPENFRHIHLRVLDTFHRMFPGVILGLSDHTPGHATVVGAVALGARVVEKHFTDDTGRTGPDHGFSMDPAAWRDMVERTRELEAALGSTEKFVAENERETVVVQRRAVRAARDLPAGTTLGPGDLEVLRPCPDDAIPPHQARELIGRTTRRNVAQGEHIRWIDLA